jgi:FtsP/CotA-like multicopper oxidase with cupredoxin domain
LRRAGPSLTRRALIGGGLAASLWAWKGGAFAEAPADAARRLEAAPCRAQIAPPPAPSTLLLSYNGATPGPLLRLRRSEELKLRLVNRLADGTTLSFPGLRGANAAAGIGGLTQPPVPPGGELDIRFTPPDAGFNLYRPDPGAATARQLASGLFGPIVVEEAVPPGVDLETIVILSDWRLDAQSAIADDFSDPRLTRAAGRLGALVTANGGPAPLTLDAAPGARVRLRLANAATARIMSIAILGAKPLIVAVDGQPSEPFEPLRNLLPVGPGARFELMFDMPREAGAAVGFTLRGGEAGGAAGEDDRPVVRFEAKGDPVAARPALAGLPGNPLLPQEIDLERAARFDLKISGGGAAPFALNGASLTDWSAKPLLTVARGAPVTLGYVNTTAVTQAMRLGGHVGRLLHALDDGWEPYWRDTILVPPGKTVHIAFVADNPGKWPIGSAIPEHRAAGLAAWMQVG